MALACKKRVGFQLEFLGAHASRVPSEASRLGYSTGFWREAQKNYVLLREKNNYNSYRLFKASSRDSKVTVRSEKRATSE